MRALVANPVSGGSAACLVPFRLPPAVRCGFDDDEEEEDEPRFFLLLRPTFFVSAAVAFVLMGLRSLPPSAVPRLVLMSAAVAFVLMGLRSLPPSAVPRLVLMIVDSCSSWWSPPVTARRHASSSEESSCQTTERSICCVGHDEVPLMWPSAGRRRRACVSVTVADLGYYHTWRV